MSHRLSQTIKNNNIKNVIKECIGSQTLFYMVFSLILNGFSKNGLEISRLGQQLKIKKRLYKKYKEQIIEPLVDSNNYKGKEPYVWFLWFQGIDEAPEIVKFCYEHAKENLINKKLVLLDETNMFDYAAIPDFIVEKWISGKINNAHFSDILRTDLLIRHGGTWMDATVFISDKKYPEFLFDSDFFVFQKLKPGAKGNSVNLSNWFITAKPNNPVLLRVRDLLYSYWKKNDKVVDYFLYHNFLQLVLDTHTEYKKKIVEYPNSLPHILLLNLNDKYDGIKMQQILDIVSIHKLTHKISGDIKKNEENVYNYLIGRKYEK